MSNRSSGQFIIHAPALSTPNAAITNIFNDNDDDWLPMPVQSNAESTITSNFDARLSVDSGISSERMFITSTNSTPPTLYNQQIIQTPQTSFPLPPPPVCNTASAGVPLLQNVSDYSYNTGFLDNAHMQVKPQSHVHDGQAQNHSISPVAMITETGETQQITNGEYDPYDTDYDYHDIGEDDHDVLCMGDNTTGMLQLPAEMMGNENTFRNQSNRNGNKQFECTFCHKFLSSVKSLRNHIKRIHKQSQLPYKCHICDKGFVLQSNLKRHVVTHSSERAFGCPMCKKRFKKNFSLQNHIRLVHYHVKPFKCTICEKAFGKKHDLKRHTERVHATDKSNRFFCDICNKGFKVKEYLKKHHRNVHPNVPCKS